MNSKGHIETLLLIAIAVVSGTIASVFISKALGLGVMGSMILGIVMPVFIFAAIVAIDSFVSQR